MKTALIINAYSARNAGDAAIVLSTAQMLRDRGFDDIVVSSRYAVEDSDFYQQHGIAVAPAVIPFPVRSNGSELSRAFRFSGAAILALLVAVVMRFSTRGGRGLARVLSLDGLGGLARANAVVICGGGYMYSSRKRVNLSLVHSILGVILAGVARRRVVMMPQSIGPIFRRSDELLLRVGLRHVDPVLVRDKPSIAEARRVLKSGSSIELCPDIAFYGWERSGIQPKETTHSTPTVGFVVMDWTWARPVGNDRLDAYVSKIAWVVTRLAERNVRVQLFGHSSIPEHGQDDMEIARRIADLTPASVEVTDVGNSADGIRALVQSLDVVVGTRLHGCIIAMEAGTPAIALSYQPKTHGTYELLGLSRYSLDVDTFDREELLDLVVNGLGDLRALNDEFSTSVGQMRTAIRSHFAGLRS